MLYKLFQFPNGILERWIARQALFNYRYQIERFLDLDSGFFFFAFDLPSIVLIHTLQKSWNFSRCFAIMLALMFN